MHNKQKSIESIKRLIQACDEEKLGAYDSEKSQCVYFDDKGNCCSVGYFIPPNLKAELIVQGYRYSDADQLWEAFPQMEELTGFDNKLAMDIQALHDTLRDVYPSHIFHRQFKGRLVELLNTGRTDHRGLGDPLTVTL